MAATSVVVAATSVIMPATTSRRRSNPGCRRTRHRGSHPSLGGSGLRDRDIPRTALVSSRTTPAPRGSAATALRRCRPTSCCRPRRASAGRPVTPGREISGSQRATARNARPSRAPRAAPSGRPRLGTECASIEHWPRVPVPRRRFCRSASARRGRRRARRTVHPDHRQIDRGVHRATLCLAESARTRS